jgi:hypothetical protein
MGSTVSWALGHHRDDGVAGSGRTTMMQARGRHELTVSRAWEWRGGGAQHCGLRANDVVEERHRGPGDGACMVDCVTNSGRGRWLRVNGLDHGRK